MPAKKYADVVAGRKDQGAAVAVYAGPGDMPGPQAPQGTQQDATPSFAPPPHPGGLPYTAQYGHPHPQALYGRGSAAAAAAYYAHGAMLDYGPVQANSRQPYMRGPVQHWPPAGYYAPPMGGYAHHPQQQQQPQQQHGFFVPNAQQQQQQQQQHGNMYAAGSVQQQQQQGHTPRGRGGGGGAGNIQRPRSQDIAAGQQAQRGRAVQRSASLPAIQQQQHPRRHSRDGQRQGQRPATANSELRPTGGAGGGAQESSALAEGVRLRPPPRKTYGPRKQYQWKPKGSDGGGPGGRPLASAAEVSARLHELDEEKRRAEELADQMMKQAQHLLQEKSAIAAEKLKLEKERDHLLQKVELMEQVGPGPEESPMLDRDELMHEVMALREALEHMALEKQALESHLQGGEAGTGGGSGDLAYYFEGVAEGGQLLQPKAGEEQQEEHCTLSGTRLDFDGCCGAGAELELETAGCEQDLKQGLPAAGEGDAAAGAEPIVGELLREEGATSA